MKRAPSRAGRRRQAAAPRDASLPFDLVLFDLDGTLVDTAPDIADAVNASLHDHGLPVVAEHWVRNRIGNGTRALLREAIGPKGSEETLESLLGSFHRHYAAHCGRRGRMFPEAAVTLTRLRNAGVKVALATNKEQRFAEFVLKVHGLDAAFDLVVCGDTLPVKKPDGAIVRHCLKALRARASRALFVGDSEIDVRCARNGRVPIWAVPYGYNRDRDIAEAEPDRIIASLSELLQPLAPAVVAAAPAYSPRASSSSRYLRSSPRN